MQDPGRFFRANVSGGINLLVALVAAGVKRLILSSIAAANGQPERTPITEDDSLNPVNAYGESKLALERMLGSYRWTHSINYISLRYFNACGATQRYGESHVPETHIIPVLFEVALKQRKTFQLKGTDFDTRANTCIRDLCPRCGYLRPTYHGARQLGATWLSRI
jgi:UDP-glucose 4-epimerase